jgi:hypothetical protein
VVAVPSKEIQKDRMNRDFAGQSRFGLSTGTRDDVDPSV